MELNFDKEIDAILRQARDSETVPVAGDAHFAHLDADDIAAFAENALPAPARQRFTAHLADCSRCRKILSNLILLNADESAAAAASPVVAEQAAEPAVPWYRQIFALPGLAYTLAALVLLFSGVFVYIGLKNFAEEGNLATISEPSTFDSANRNAARPSEGTFSANATANAANTAMPAANTMSAANANVAVIPPPATTNAGSTTSTSVPAAPVQQPLEEDKRVSNLGAENVTVQPRKTLPEPAATPAASELSIARREAKEEFADVAEAEKSNEKRDAAKRKKGAVTNAPAPTENLATKSREDETRVVSGKTFRQVGGTWFDSAYRTQPQTAVRRGSDEYERLESDLRAIAEQLSGTVVVVWKGKAYRIQ